MLKCWMFWCMSATTLVTGNWYARHPYSLISIQNNKWLECWLWIVRCKLNTQHGCGCLFICLFVWTTIWWFKDAHHTLIIIIINDIFFIHCVDLCGLSFFWYLVLNILYDFNDERMKWKDKNNTSGHRTVKQ